MELRNAATFVKVVEFNNFTKAAESLGYSQSAVTTQIKALEAELGVPLFDRIGRGIVLTQEGRTFLPYALNLLKAEEEAISSVRPTEHLSGQLKICSASSYAMGPLPEILLRFQKAHPDVSVTVKVSDFLEDTTGRLARGELDFLVCMDEENAYPQFQTVVTRPEEIIFVTYPDNPLCRKKKLTAADIVEHEFILSDREIGYCAILEKYLRKNNVEIREAMELGSVAAIVQLMLRGFGVSFIPAFMAKDHIRSGELVRLHASDFELTLQSYFLCSRDRWINPIMREFIRIIEEK